jgi:hypothetical protein
MKKYFLFYIATGLVAPLWYIKVTQNNLNINLAIMAMFSAFALLLIGRIDNKNLLIYSLLSLSISIIFLDNIIGAILYNIFAVISLSLIQARVAKEKGTSEKNFSHLNFYSQIAFAVSLIVGAYIIYPQLIAVGLLTGFGYLIWKNTQN